MADRTLHLGTAVEVEPLEIPRDQRDTCDNSWLVEGLRQGTEAAYELLIAQYQQPLYNLAVRLLSHTDRETVVARYLPCLGLASSQAHLSLQTFFRCRY